MLPWVEDEDNPVRNGCEWETVWVDRPWKGEPNGLGYGTLGENMECSFYLGIA